MGEFNFVWGQWAYGPAKRAALTGGPRHVAVPFLDAAAPDTLFLARGDRLVVDASPAAVRSGSTSPDAVRFYMDKGVRVYSRQGLQANVIATKRMGVIISTIGRYSMVYDSTWIRQPSRPVLVTSDPEIVGELHTLVEEEIWHGEEVTYVLLAELSRIWSNPSSADQHACIQNIAPPAFVPDPRASVFFDHSIPDDELMTPEEANQPDPQTDEPIPLYYTEGLELEADDPGLPVASVLVDFHRVGGVQPPMVVVSPPIPLPGSEGHRFQVLRGCRDCDYPYAWGEVICWTTIDELTILSIRQTDTVLEVKHSARPHFLHEFFELWNVHVAPPSEPDPDIPNPEVAAAFDERPLGTRNRFILTK